MLTPIVDLWPATPVEVPVLVPAVAAPPAIGTARVLHLINGEHYSGAERVQDLLARELPQFGYEVGFGCVKPLRFPAAREAKTAPLFEFPMRGRFDLRVVKKIVRLVESEKLRADPRPYAAHGARRPARRPAARLGRWCITSTAPPATTRPACSPTPSTRWSSGAASAARTG